MRWDISANTDWLTIEVWGETPDTMSEIEAIMEARYPIDSVFRPDAIVMFHSLLELRRQFLSQHGAGSIKNDNNAQIHQVKA